MFHLELFSSSIANGANAFAQLNYFAADAIFPKLNNGMQVSADLPYLMWVAGVGANLVHVRPQAPSMQPLPYPNLSPNNRGTAFESPPRVHDFSNAPIPLSPTEEFDIFATQNSAGAQTQYVACLFSDGKTAAPPLPTSSITLNGNGRYFTAHATAAQTLTAGAWTQCLPIFDQALPAGYYALIGARTFSATALFFRMFPARQPLWRPGGIAVQAYDQLDPPGQRAFPAVSEFGDSWGTWLTFWQNVPPQVEIFATAADTAEEFWFDLIKLNDSVTMGAI